MILMRSLSETPASQHAASTVLRRTVLLKLTALLAALSRCAKTPRRLKVLRNLSLHGNPLEDNFSNLSSGTHASTNADAASPKGAAPNAATDLSGYRLSVIAKIPWLRKLDFVTVTKGERLEISNEATRLSARGLRRRQRLLERADGGAHLAGQPHHSGAEGHYVSGTHKLVQTLQRIHVSTAAGEHPEKIVAKAVIDTGRN
jgi:hypothetical protein